MRRRDFIKASVGAAAAWPLVARAQQPARMRRIGILMGLNEKDYQQRVADFEQGLKELGWEIGQNIFVDYRWAGGDAGRIRTYAAELADLNLDVIVAHAPAVLSALRDQTRSIPIVFLEVADPVGNGFVASLAAPGGNITGFTNFEFTTGGKWLELLREIAPRVSRVMIILNPGNPTAPGYVRAIEPVAAHFAMQVTATPVSETVDYEDVIASFAREPNSGLIVLPDLKAAAHRDRIIQSAARHRLPAVYPSPIYATSGGLVSYGPDFYAQWRQAPTYVDRILKGEKPATLPIQGPTKFVLLVNLKTAKALELTVPPLLLDRADEVIE